MRVVVGRIGRAHGIRGDVAVEVRTDEPESRFASGAVLFTDPVDVGPLVVASTKTHSGRLLVRFERVDDRGGAERLRGVMLLSEVDSDESPEHPDEFYDRQIVGLAVNDVNRGLIGTVAEVVHLPGQELLAVRRERGPEVLIPFVAVYVTEVDLRRGRVEVDLPDGLLELGEN